MNKYVGVEEKFYVVFPLLLTVLWICPQNTYTMTLCITQKSSSNEHKTLSNTI